jgi:protein-tyrosine phosphatase
VKGFIDLHCHWVAGIDDGARSTEDSRAMLLGLKRAGFDRVVATPHMRPGMFENSRDDLQAAFERTCLALGPDLATPAFPAVGLSSEHWLDDVVLRRVIEGSGVPYPGEHAVLFELAPGPFPQRLANRLYELRRKKLRPVLAHPERYEPVWKDAEVVEPLLDVGVLLQLDVAALAGKYGRSPRKAAEELLEREVYSLACSDAHKPADLADVTAGIEALFKRVGEEEARFLLSQGPAAILSGDFDAFE